MPSDEPRVPCNICRTGGTVGNPLATIARVGPAPGFPITCQQAEIAASTTMFTQTQCFIAQGLAAAESICGCSGGITSSPATAPVPPTPTMAPVPGTPAPTVGAACSICLNGNDIQNNTGVVAGMTCLQLDVDARAGMFSSVECAIIQGLTSNPAIFGDPCGCFPDTPGMYSTVFYWCLFCSCLKLLTNTVLIMFYTHMHSPNYPTHSSTHSSSHIHAYKCSYSHTYS